MYLWIFMILMLYLLIYLWYPRTMSVLLPIFFDQEVQSWLLSNIHQMNYYTHGPLQNHCHLLYAGSIPKLQWNGNLEWWCLHCWNYRMIILSTYILSTERIMYNINLPPSGGTDFFLIQQGLTTGEHSKWKFYFLYMFSIRDLEGRIKKS